MIYVLAAGFALVLGLVLAGSGYRNYALARQSHTWPIVTGKIAASSIKSGRGAYAPNVTYWYKVDGVEYSSSRVTFGTVWRYGNLLKVAKEIQQRYPFGGTVEVHYNPNNPRQAVLDPRVGDAGIALTLGSIVTILAIVVLILSALGL
jgi:hypothetical protein